MTATLGAVLERVEQGEAWDIQLNADIHEAFGLPFEMEYWTENDTVPVPNRSKVPLYTSSVDAVIELVERALPGYAHAYDARPDRLALAWVDTAHENHPSMPSLGSSAARAMLAAAIRARIAQE